MDILKKILTKERIFSAILPSTLLFLAFLYYFPFTHLGLDFVDEGYILYNAKRIFLGEIAYRDFSWVYTPGQIVVLSLLFKLFSPEILVGRYYTLFLHLSIIACQMVVLAEFKIPKKILIPFVLASIAFGLPLMNIPYPVLPAVLFSITTLIFYLKLEKNNGYLQYCLLGVSVAFILFFKQNAGVYYYVLGSLLTLGHIFNSNFKANASKVILYHISFWLITFAWVFPLFLDSNIAGLKEFLAFSFYFKNNFLFTYPTFALLGDAFGLFKLIPYYLPLIAGMYLMYLRAFQKIQTRVILPLVFALVGFFGNIYPGSDLLHVYPFYSTFLIALFILLSLRGKVKTALLLALLHIAMGVYLTFFRGHLRYEPPYKSQTIPLRVAHGSGIFTYASKVKGTQELIQYMNMNVPKNEKILVYPFAPMVYFLLDYQNISRDSVFYPVVASMIKEDLLKTFKGKRYYIITIGNYLNETPYSIFISKQKEIFSSEFYKVYRVE